MTDYFFRAAPDICNWLMSSACGDLGYALMRRYNELIQPGHHVVDAPIYAVLPAENAAQLVDGLQRSEHFAMLMTLPLEMRIAQHQHLTKLHPNLREQGAQAQLRVTRDYAHDSLAVIRSQAQGLRESLAQADQQLQWLDLMRKDKMLSLGDADRAEFMRLKHQVEQGETNASPLTTARACLSKVKENLLVLRVQNEQSFHAADFGEEAGMADACNLYAQKTLYPEVMRTLAHSHDALIALDGQFQQRMASLHRKYKKASEQLPGNTVEHGVVTNVVQLRPAKNGTDTGRTG